MRSGRCALTLLAPVLLVSACAHGPRRANPNASAPTVRSAQALDVAAIPEPVPREEPRSAAGNPPFYEVAGHRYIVLASAAGYHERGVASWYGSDFHGLRTATGERYDMFAITAAHRTLPIPCYARVTNLSNGHSVVVRINDRGPFVANRIIDLSYTAALKLDMIRNGTAFVQVEALTPATPAATAALPATTPAASAASVGVSNVPAVTAPLEPAASAPPQLAAPATAASGHFYIQVGAYGQADNAHLAGLSAGGEDVIFVEFARSDFNLLRPRSCGGSLRRGGGLRIGSRD